MVPQGIVASLDVQNGNNAYNAIVDYSSDFSNLSNQYSAAGYGPETDYTSLSNQYSAGAYGGAGFMSQVSSRFLQPTIGMPRMG